MISALLEAFFAFTKASTIAGSLPADGDARDGVGRRGERDQRLKSSQHPHPCV